jgi:hypothetical protein
MRVNIARADDTNILYPQGQLRIAEGGGREEYRTVIFPREVFLDITLTILRAGQSTRTE